MNATDIVLAIDMGSTWCKAAYVDRAGSIVAEGRVYTRGGPPFGHDAHDLERSWAALTGAVQNANRLLQGRGVPEIPAAIALSCRKAPGIWLDGNDTPVAPPRAAVESTGRARIEECYASSAWGEPGPFAYGYGVDLLGNTRWLWRHFPELWEQVRRAGTLHTWLMYRLTGRWVTSQTAGPGRFAWPDVVTELTGLPVAAYPEVIASDRTAGTLTADAAGRFGLPSGIAVVSGTHDGAAANLGAGAIHPGDACLTLGTNGVLRVVTGVPLERQFGYPIVEGRWAMVRDIVGIAPHLDYLVAAIDGAGLPVSAPRHARLTAAAAQVSAGAAGLRLAVWPGDPRSEEHEAERQRIAEAFPAGVVYRAALEGVAFAFRGLVDVAQQAGARPDRYVVTGGATANTLLLRIMSGVIGAPMRVSAAEAGVRGAAILAASGAGWFPSLDAAVAGMVPDGGVVSASAVERAAYADLMREMELPAGVAPGDPVRGVKKDGD